MKQLYMRYRNKYINKCSQNFVHFSFVSFAFFVRLRFVRSVNLYDPGSVQSRCSYLFYRYLYKIVKQELFDCVIIIQQLFDCVIMIQELFDSVIIKQELFDCVIIKQELFDCVIIIIQELFDCVIIIQELFDCVIIIQELFDCVIIIQELFYFNDMSDIYYILVNNAIHHNK